MMDSVVPNVTKTMEAEAKYRIDDVVSFRVRLVDAGAVPLQTEKHRDIYLRHPSRDFRATDEALRIREVDGRPWITYKGPRLAGPVKVRPEIELALGQNDLESWLQIWRNLGFEIVTEVKKTRESFRIIEGVNDSTGLTVTIDQVERVGCFAEIERIVDAPGEIDAAVRAIESLASRLELVHRESRSYLGLLLAGTSDGSRGD